MTRVKLPGQANKYRARATEYGGRRYHSAAEAAYAGILDVKLRAKQIRSWEPQFSLAFVVNGVKICRHVVDFRVVNLDGTVSFIEVKGYETDVYKLKRKLMAALYPDASYEVVGVAGGRK